MVMLAPLTVLPALLGFCGRTIDRLRIGRRRGAGVRPGSLWHRWSRVVQRRPWPVAAGPLALLLVLAAPVAAMRLGFGDAGNRPTTDTARRAYDLVSSAFGPGFNGPVFVAVDLAGVPAADGAEVLRRLPAAISADPGVALVTPALVNPAGDVAVVQVFPTTSPQDEATGALVARLRDGVVPAVAAGTGARVLVGGAVAGVVDFSSLQGDRLPLFIGAVWPCRSCCWSASSAACSSPSRPWP
jgi:RND superfamily putative drug exporter